MKEDLQEILDLILIKAIEFKLQPDLLYPQLRIHKYLTDEEIELIEEKKTTSTKLLKTFTLLKGKPDDVILGLQKICQSQSLLDLLIAIHSTLKEFKKENLIWQPSTNLKIAFHFSDEQLNIRKILKQRYGHDLAVIDNYWQKVNFAGSLSINTFHKDNIVIKDEVNKLESNFDSIDQLFTTDSLSRRITIFGSTGCGKSTFVNEIIRQWVKGEDKWTEQIHFLYFFHIVKVSKNCSIKSLIKEHFNGEESSLLNNWLEEEKHNSMKNSMFIFDGLYEQDRQVSYEMENIIFGTAANQAYVVVTIRPELSSIEKQIQEDIKLLHGHLTVYMNNYSDKVSDLLLKDSSLFLTEVDTYSKRLLKVPLFNNLFRIGQNISSQGSINLCAIVANFVKAMCHRYKAVNQDFTEEKENEILSILGEVAQYQYEFIMFSNNLLREKHREKTPEVTSQALSMAIECGLVYAKSTTKHIFFAHQMIAEYFASYFWVATDQIYNCQLANDVMGNGQIVTFVESQRLWCQVTFSSFLGHLSPEYKTFLWKNFCTYVPLLDDYDNLPIRDIDCRLSFEYLPLADHSKIMEKIEFSSSNSLEMLYANFENGKMFKNMKNIKDLNFQYCLFNLHPKEFFDSNHSTYIKLNGCVFYDADYVIETEDEIHSKKSENSNLEYLNYTYTDYTGKNFLSYIMKKSINLKAIRIRNCMKDENLKQEVSENVSKFETVWINELQNNEKLIRSIERFELTCRAIGEDLTPLFEILGKMDKLKVLLINVHRDITTSEANAALSAFNTGLQVLERCKCSLYSAMGSHIHFNEVWQGQVLERCKCNLNSAEESSLHLNRAFGEVNVFPQSSMDGVMN